MKGTSKVIMGATLVMVVSLAMVLGLVLVLLAELYCSLLLRRRQLGITTTSTSTSTPTTAASAVTTTTAASTNNSSSQQRLPKEQSAAALPPLRSFYAQGVLHAPRSVLFPEVLVMSNKEGNVDIDIEKQQTHLHHQILLESQTQEPNQIGLIVTPSPQHEPIHKVSLQGGYSTSNDGKHLIYISNPMYDNEAGQPNTPFETPDTSPSRLEMGGSSGADDDKDTILSPPTSTPASSLPNTPPLTPMKKLPAEACSVSLRDARSLATSGSDSNINSNNGGSSSSSGSPCTSPSW